MGSWGGSIGGGIGGVLWVFGGGTELFGEGFAAGGVEVADYHTGSGGVLEVFYTGFYRRKTHPSAANFLNMPSPMPLAPPVMRMVFAFAVSSS